MQEINDKQYDVIIIGGGAAGLTAAIYTARKKLKTLILTYDIGGQTNLTNRIENYPGIEAMTGTKLMQKFQEQALNFGAEIIMGKALRVEKKAEQKYLITLTNNEIYFTKTIILAFGKVPNMLGIPGEEKFLGRGVSTCATCDAPLYSKKNVGVIGGGNSAIEATAELAKIANKVYLIHRREQFRADAITIEKLRKKPNVELITNSTAIEIKGDKFLKEIVIKNINTEEKRTLTIDGIFIEIGYKIDPSIITHLVKINDKNEIIVDDHGRTSDEGIFAAGDVTIVPYKQTIISAGEGAKAALQAYSYLTGGKGVLIDWTH